MLGSADASMSRKRQKLHNAAYAASQPLFSALRNASATSIPAQTASLTTARDVVQSLHVEIADTDNTHNDISRHEQYMDSAVKAWGSAVDAYCEIFTEMVKITGSEPSKGREEGSRHREFVAMLDSAKRAKDIVEEFCKTKEAANSQEGSDETSEIEVTNTQNTRNKRPQGTGARIPNGVSKESSHAEDQRPAEAQKEHQQLPLTPSALSGNIRYDTTGKKVLWDNGELKVPYVSLDPADRRAWDLIKRKAKRKSRHQALKRARTTTNAEAQAQANEAPETAQESAADDTQQQQQQPDSGVGNVEYEDVSAEVERRMKAKADKKAAEKAKKSEKKRKRESADSTTAVAGPVEGESITVTQKPSKKKAKKEASEESEIQVNGTAEAAEPKTASGKLAKRKQQGSGESAENNTSTQATKKRKKGKS